MSEQPKLTLKDDCADLLPQVLDQIQTAPRDQLTNVVLQLALAHMQAVAVPGTDAETLRVLAVYELAEVLKRTERFFDEQPVEPAPIPVQ